MQRRGPLLRSKCPSTNLAFTLSFSYFLMGKGLSVEIGQGEESHSCRRCEVNMNVPLVQRADLLADIIGMIHILLQFYEF